MAKLTQLYEQKIFRIVGSNVGTVYFYILDLCVYFTCVYIPYASLGPGGLLDSLKLGVNEWLSCRVCARNQTWILYKTSKWFEQLIHFSSPGTVYFNQCCQVALRQGCIDYKAISLCQISSCTITAIHFYTCYVCLVHLPWLFKAASHSQFMSSCILLLVQFGYRLFSSLAFPFILSGDYSDAIETLLTAIAVIKQSRVANDERCRVLISSLKDCLHGIEAKSYSVGASGSSSRWVDCFGGWLALSNTLLLVGWEMKETRICVQ